jgi:hypothetical protein
MLHLVALGRSGSRLSGPVEIMVGVAFGCVGAQYLVFHRRWYSFARRLRNDAVWAAAVAVSVYVLPWVFVIAGIVMIVRGATSS